MYACISEIDTSPAAAAMSIATTASRQSTTRRISSKRARSTIVTGTPHRITTSDGSNGSRDTETSPSLRTRPPGPASTGIGSRLIPSRPSPVEVTGAVQPQRAPAGDRPAGLQPGGLLDHALLGHAPVHVRRHVEPLAAAPPSSAGCLSLGRSACSRRVHGDRAHEVVRRVASGIPEVIRAHRPSLADRDPVRAGPSTGPLRHQRTLFSGHFHRRFVSQRGRQRLTRIRS